MASETPRISHRYWSASDRNAAGCYSRQLLNAATAAGTARLAWKIRVRERFELRTGKQIALEHGDVFVAKPLVLFN